MDIKHAREELRLHRAIVEICSDRAAEAKRHGDQALESRMGSNVTSSKTRISQLMKVIANDKKVSSSKNKKTLAKKPSGSRKESKRNIKVSYN